MQRYDFFPEQSPQTPPNLHYLLKKTQRTLLLPHHPSSSFPSALPSLSPFRAPFPPPCSCFLLPPCSCSAVFPPSPLSPSAPALRPSFLIPCPSPIFSPAYLLSHPLPASSPSSSILPHHPFPPFLLRPLHSPPPFRQFSLLFLFSALFHSSICEKILNVSSL